MKKTFSFLLLALLPELSLAQDFALEQLEKSPRHHEWAEIEYNGRTVHTFVAYPETSEKATAVMVIHENRGLTDWVRSFADQLAAAGYIAVAPDLLSGAEGKTKTSDFVSSDAARSAIYELDQEQVTADLQAVQDYAASLPAANGKTVVTGFCWGGSQTFKFVTNNSEVSAGLVFYGTAPKEASELAKIAVPVYGFYGGDDNRVNATIPETEKQMQQAGNTYQYKIYPGAGHAYMRRGDDPEGGAENRAARDASRERLLNILANL